MENIDLDINNYEIDDILKLFNIDYNFNEDDLRNSKKMVLMMHPDKSNLDKEYFLFFSKAYKILYSIYNFRDKYKLNDNMKLNNNTEYLVHDIDEDNKEIIKNLKKSKYFDSNNFNKWFNELFEKINISNEFNNNGYGNWLKTDEISSEIANNIDSMNKIIDKKKEELRESKLSKYSRIHEYNNNNYCDLTNSKPENYSSDLFSKFQYEDLKKAHEESVIPVTYKDFNKKYNNIEEIQEERQKQNMNPLTDEEYKKIRNNDKYEENIIETKRAYKLFIQQEEIDNQNKKWWATLKQLK